MPRAALLVMDVQNQLVDMVGESGPPLLVALRKVTAGARSRGIPVIFVRTAFRPDAPEISAHNSPFSGVKQSASFQPDGPRREIHADLTPHPDELVVVKKRISAFAGSDLSLILSSLEVRSLVLTGISTHGVVLSTLRQANDLDFEITVLSDGCADIDDEVHRVLLEKVFPFTSTVITIDEWLGQLGT